MKTKVAYKPLTSPLVRKPRFTETVSENANTAWGFNCGPAALCAVLGLTPEELRPHLGDFEQKHYTNPTLMLQALNSAGASFLLKHRSDMPGPMPMLVHGVVRIQWSGPWTKPATHAYEVVPANLEVE